MAKVSSVEKNRHRKGLVKKFKDRRRELKKNVMDKSLPAEERFSASLKLAKLPRNSAKNRVVSRCVLTGRPHAVYRKFGLSRIALRDLASNGKIPGLVKASW